jgi:FKBP-type peptidyl-prolyl cis-trans isomerase FkpA
MLLHVRRSTPALLVVPLVLPALLAGCVEAPTAPSGDAPFSQTDLRVGEGPTAEAGSIVTTHYTVWLYDPAQPEQKGVQVDSSRGLEPFMFVVGFGQVISGWDVGITGMNVGGLRRLVIPPSLAYGGFRNSIIPPNATLVFEIELLAIELLEEE